MSRALETATALIFLLQAGPAAGSVGDPVYSGTLCPEGTVSVAMTEDSSALSVLFDQFIVEAGGSTGRAVATGACSVRIPVRVPPEFQMGVFKIDYRGFNDLPHQAKSKPSVSYSLGGARSPDFHKQFTSGASGEFTVTDTIGAGHMRWTACGAPAMIELTSSFAVQSNRRGDAAMAMLDSIDGTARGGILYALKWQRCRR